MYGIGEIIAKWLQTRFPSMSDLSASLPMEATLSLLEIGRSRVQSFCRMYSSILTNLSPFYRHVKFWYVNSSKIKERGIVPLTGRSGILGDQRNNNFLDVAIGKGEMVRKRGILKTEHRAFKK